MKRKVSVVAILALIVACSGEPTSPPLAPSDVSLSVISGGGGGGAGGLSTGILMTSGGSLVQSGNTFVGGAGGARGLGGLRPDGPRANSGQSGGMHTIVQLN